MPLETHAINPSNLEHARVVKAECVQCFRVKYVETATMSDALDDLHKAGWRSYETDDEVGDPICPTCIHNMKSEDD